MDGMSTRTTRDLRWCRLPSDGSQRHGERKPDGNSILYIPPAMARRAGRERSISGTELEEPKLVARGGEGTGECVENVTHGAVEVQGNLCMLGARGLKKGLKRPVGCGGRDAEKDSQSRSFLPPFHRYVDDSG
jgi:hypothetical protein